MNSNLTEKKQIRKFGFIAFIFFGILCGLGLWQLALVTFVCIFFILKSKYLIHKDKKFERKKRGKNGNKRKKEVTVRS